MAKRNPYETARTVPFTNKEMELMVGVTPMTLHLWRKGATTKSGPLKTGEGPGGTVRYPVRSTMTWLARNEVPIVVHPDDLGKPHAGARAFKKPGPKPRATAVLAARALERPSAR